MQRQPKATQLKEKDKKEERAAQSSVLDVSAKLLFAAAGPVVAVESCLDQRRHDAAHTGFIGAAVPLAVVLHSQTTGKIKQAGLERREVTGRQFYQLSVVLFNKRVSYFLWTDLTLPKIFHPVLSGRAL